MLIKLSMGLYTGLVTSIRPVLFANISETVIIRELKKFEIMFLKVDLNSDLILKLYYPTALFGCNYHLIALAYLEP
jgi:hypothetical protein